MPDSPSNFSPLLCTVLTLISTSFISLAPSSQKLGVYRGFFFKYLSINFYFIFLQIGKCLKPSFVLSCTGADLFSNCTEECKALGHSDRCWMPSFVPSDARQGPDYRSNLHVPGMDSVPDTEVFKSPKQMADKSLSTFVQYPVSHRHFFYP